MHVVKSILIKIYGGKTQTLMDSLIWYDFQQYKNFEGGGGIFIKYSKTSNYMNYSRHYHLYLVCEEGGGGAFTVSNNVHWTR